MSIVVLRGGLATSVQACGASGFGRYGVPERGALDPLSLRIANMLVGNDACAPALEMTLDGPHLRLETAARLAVCGADMIPTVDGRPMPQWRPVDVGAGTTIRFGVARDGARCYLAVAGGFDVPQVLGSRSTHVRSGFGGYEGRVLRAGDRLASDAMPPPSFEEGAVVAERWSVAHELRPPMSGVRRVRVIATGDGGCGALDGRELTIDAASDRMGIRLVESTGAHERSIVSEPAMLGAIQLPPDGRPIVLMNDHQTTGGYPVIAYVATVDLPTLGQSRPGDRVRFEPIDVGGAERLLHERERMLGRLSRWIAVCRTR